MRTDIRAPGKLTDEEVRAILLAPAEVTNLALAVRYDVSTGTINSYRQRKFKRALRVAVELKLLAPPVGLPGRARADIPAPRERQLIEAVMGGEA